MKQMMKKYLYMAAVAVVGTGFLMSSCKDEFAGQNTNPSTVSKPNVRYLFTQCAMSFQPADYLQWFAGFDAMSTWVQATASGGGNSSKLNMVTQTGCGYQVNEVLRYTNEIKHQISLMSDDEKAKYEYIAYLCNPMLVYLGLEDSDMYGSRQYSEAEMARYGGTLTPKYDTQEELFELWLKQLDETINYLRENNPQDVLGAQDFIYRGKLDKWAKLANSLKLRIAARLINKDKARAIAIVNEAAQNPAGLILTLDDDFVFNKGKRDNNWNNDISVGAGTKQLIDFMVSNRDPRLFYFFQMNDYNSNVVQGFFDQKRALPSYVEANVNYTVDADGKKHFESWKAPGEPWVRYYGVPCQVDINKKEEYKDYFDPNNELFYLLSKDGAKKTYTPIAYRNTENIKGLLIYTFPDVPDVAPVQDKEEYGWYGLYFSAGETNLLLAEFKLLGANLPMTAQQYLSAGVEMSVRGYDFVSAKNHIPYYDKTYTGDVHDKTISVKEGMIDEMLSHDAYHLTGDLSKDLEKVYIQQYIHYLMLPMDMFVTARRSGVPMKNSTLLPYQDFDPLLGDQYVIPRRFPVSKPLDSDMLRDITIAAYQAQGYTYEGEMSNSPVTLSKERVWYDKEAPAFGTGPQQ